MRLNHTSTLLLSNNLNVECISSNILWRVLVGFKHAGMITDTLGLHPNKPANIFIQQFPLTTYAICVAVYSKGNRSNITGSKLSLQ